MLILLSVTLTGTLLSGSAQVDASVRPFVISQPDPPIQPLPEPTAIGIPTRILIPSIAVDAVVGQVGLTAQGAMEAPADPMEAGWYSHGIRPGDVGSAAIAGHVDWWYGATGVFADLHTLKPGDLIQVQDDIGATVSFVVRELRTFDAEADATDVFVSTDGHAHLNLITCFGVWDTGAKTYSERLVVFADRVDPP